MKAKNLKKQLMAAIAMTMVAVISLGSSTYAWFVNNTTVSATGIDVTAQASNTLLISQNDTISWGTTIALATENGFNKDIGMIPVSTIGSTDGSSMDFYTSTTAGWAAEGNNFVAGAFDAVADTNGTTGTTAFYKDSFKVKASQACNLYLTDATQIVASVGDLDATLRLAILVNGTDDTKDKAFFYQIDDAALTNKVNSTATAVGTDVDGINLAISGPAASAKIAPLNSASGVPAIGDKYAKAPADSNTLVSNVGSADTLYNFTTADEVCDVTVYVWMEGCDHDCVAAEVANFTAAGDHFAMNLAFGAGA